MYVGKKKSSNSSITSVQFYNAEGKGGGRVPWVPEVFLACGGKFRCWPKADTSSAVGRSREKNAGHYKDLTEIGNRARKVSGTQGIFAPKSHRNACFASYRGTDYVQQKKQYNQSIKPPGELYCLVPLFLL